MLSGTFIITRKMLVMLLGRCDGALLALSRSQLVGPVAARDGPRDRSGPLGTARDQPGPAGTGRDQSGRSGRPADGSLCMHNECIMMHNDA